MSSASIYTPIKPTYLYIKQHSVTGLKYFGKTTKTDPYKYSGSGGYWKNHIKKHGKKFIKTIWVSDLYYDTSIVEHALHFSIENNIVKSNSHKGKTPWNKGKICNPQTEESKNKTSMAKKGILQPIVTCPRCNKTGGASNMKRYHFDNCKLK